MFYMCAAHCHLPVQTSVQQTTVDVTLWNYINVHLAKSWNFIII